jgi:hypothetical protein
VHIERKVGKNERERELQLITSLRRKKEPYLVGFSL